VAVIQSAIVLSACSNGLGKSISLVPLATQTKVQQVSERVACLRVRVAFLISCGQLYYASTLFFVIGVGMSKLSVVCFLLRLSPVQRHRMVFYGAAGVVGVWTVASLFAMAFQCNSSHPWLIVGEQCPGMVSSWTITQLLRGEHWLILSGENSLRGGVSFLHLTLPSRSACSFQPSTLSGV
jgi:hypothetical protein